MERSGVDTVLLEKVRNVEDNTNSQLVFAELLDDIAFAEENEDIEHPFKDNGNIKFAIHTAMKCMSRENISLCEIMKERLERGDYGTRNKIQVEAESS